MGRVPMSGTASSPGAAPRRTGLESISRPSAAKTNIRASRLSRTMKGRPRLSPEAATQSATERASAEAGCAAKSARRTGPARCGDECRRVGNLDPARRQDEDQRGRGEQHALLDSGPQVGARVRSAAAAPRRCLGRAIGDRVTNADGRREHQFRSGFGWTSAGAAEVSLETTASSTSSCSTACWSSTTAVLVDGVHRAAGRRRRRARCRPAGWPCRSSMTARRRSRRRRRSTRQRLPRSGSWKRSRESPSVC